MQAEQQSERERFEAYIAKDCGDLSTFGVDPNRHYRNSGVNHAWVAWQARAALSHPSPQGWQDIATAPRDATAILVMRNIWPGTKSGRAEECNGHNTYVAEWWTDGWVCYMDAVSDPECPIEPTHWMPLPPPPPEQGSKG